MSVLTERLKAQQSLAIETNFGDFINSCFSSSLDYPWMGSKQLHLMQAEQSPAGVVFVCPKSTAGECLKRRIFAMRQASWPLVERIQEGTICFMYEEDTEVMSFGNCKYPYCYRRAREGFTLVFTWLPSCTVVLQKYADFAKAMAH